MFSSVYNSEFCKESWETITKDWCYEEFLDMYNHVQYMNDLRKGQELDIEDESRKERMRNEALSGRR
jgi:hypothetical protein